MQQLTLFDRPTTPRFDGPAYIEKIFNLMRDGKWRTLGEIEAATHEPAASISAQLRHLRKARFGAHTVDKRRRGEKRRGLWEYQLIESANR